MLAGNNVNLKIYWGNKSPPTFTATAIIEEIVIANANKIDEKYDLQQDE